ncbi:unnamed protein product, partial [Aphanomyces euteiches]
MSTGPPTTAKLVLSRTRSQEVTLSAGVALPLSPQHTGQFAAYPPDTSGVHEWGQQVQSAVQQQASQLETVQHVVGAQASQIQNVQHVVGAQAAQIETVQNVVGAQASQIHNVQQAVGQQQQFTYEQLMALAQQQQQQYQDQMAMNMNLMHELEEQKEQQKRLVSELNKQASTTRVNARDIKTAAYWLKRNQEQIDEVRRRASLRWQAFATSHASSPEPVNTPAAPTIQVQPPPMQLVYGFQEVPKAPTFNGSTKAQMKRFMDQYQAYRREIEIANGQRPGGVQIQPAPLSSCVDPAILERIAFWDHGKPSSQVTEEDWKAYFLDSQDDEPVDLAKLNSAMSKLKMDTNIQSPESRVSKLISDFELILVRLSMEGFAELEPKKTVDFLVAAIQPVSVRERIKELLSLQENRALKKDARAFRFWLANYMKRFGEFEPLMAASAKSAGAVKVKDDGPSLQKKNRKDRNEKKHIVVAVAKSDDVPDANFFNEKRACFKCLMTDHNVFKCPKVVEGEAKILMDRARAVWKKAADSDKAPGQAAAPQGQQKAERVVTVVEKQDQPGVTRQQAVGRSSGVVCIANNTLTLDVSFDSGADQSVLPRKTLELLRAQGKMVKVTKLESPIMVKGFVGAAYQVNEEATLDLRFNTESGPLLLANVKCCRPIMVKLGYDPLTLLKDAAIISDEYDMQDAVANSGVVKAVLFAQQEMVDDLASEEAELVPMELDACFPEVNKTSGDETRAEVKAVLDSKVAEAVDYGCGDEFASRLSELLVLYSD